MKLLDPIYALLLNTQTGEFYLESFSDLVEFRLCYPLYADGRDEFLNTLPLTAKLADWEVRIILFDNNGKMVIEEDMRPFEEDLN